VLNLRNFEGFACWREDPSYEYKILYHYAMHHDITIKKLNHNEKCPENFIAYGSIKFCTESLNKPIIPNYYPEWLSAYFHRKVWKSDKWILGEKLFVKPADVHKRFNGFCTHGTYSKKKKPPYWYSEIVRFTNEWRYYVTDGKILCGKWYMGDEINTPDAPTLQIDIPSSFSGTLDFGTLLDGKLALVEAHEPFACGWYGTGFVNEDNEVYLQWIVDGWRYLLDH